MRPKTPDAVRRRLQGGDPLARIRELLADAVEIAGDLEGDDLEGLLTQMVEQFDSAIEEEAEGDEDEAAPAENRRPRSADYGSRKEFRAAMRRWRKRKARAVGEATIRGSTPRIITRDPDED